MPLDLIVRWYFFRFESAHNSLCFFVRNKYIFWRFFYLFYCRKDAGKRKKLKEEHFKLLKDRYKEILGDLELETLSSDFDEKKENTTAHYIKMRMTQVTWLWSACLAIIFMAITVILICNLNTPIKDAETTCHTGVERMC